MPEKKKLAYISFNELWKPAGRQLMIGLANDMSDMWKIVREPNGTFWEVSAMDSFISMHEPLRVYLGDQITDAGQLAQCEAYCSLFVH